MYDRFEVKDDKLRSIARYVYEWYDKRRIEYGDLEEILLDELKVDTVDGRFEVVMLAILFSEWAMREERAYNLWKRTTTWLRSNNLSYYDVFSGENKEALKGLIILLEEINAPSRFLSKMSKTAKKLRRYGGDLNGLVDEDDWAGTVSKIKGCRIGVSQKAFWVARVMRQKGAWMVPGEFCCVSDSHNKAFLKKTGFIVNDNNLFANSRVMWKYFNEPFKRQYYDLSPFRFARHHGCKNCHEACCNLEKMKLCELKRR